MIPWGGFTCCLGTAALYLLSRRTGRNVEILKSVTRVHQLKDLAQLLEGKVLPLMISVSGRVGSEASLKSEHSGISCVIVEETVEQHFLKRNWEFSWVEDSASMRPMIKEVPWYLEDGTGRVNVAGAQGATGFTLTVGRGVFEKSEPSSFFRETLETLQGLKMLGEKRIERVLPTGTPLTAVGEAVKDATGDIRIQKPEDGPFYVSPVPLDQIIPKLGKWSRRFKNASMCLTVLGVILISKPVIEYIVLRTGYYLERRRQRLLRKRVVDAAAKREEERVTTGLGRQHENTSRDGEVPDLCVICLEEKYNAVFVQ